jgi:hypothetical protein
MRGRLAPQERRAAVAGLTGGPGSLDVIGPGAQPWVTAIIVASRGASGWAAGWSGAGHDVKVAKAAHSPHRQEQLFMPLSGLQQRCRYQQTLTPGR